MHFPVYKRLILNHSLTVINAYFCLDILTRLNCEHGCLYINKNPLLRLSVCFRYTNARLPAVLFLCGFKHLYKTTQKLIKKLKSNLVLLKIAHWYLTELAANNFTVWTYIRMSEKYRRMDTPLSLFHILKPFRHSGTFIAALGWVTRLLNHNCNTQSFNQQQFAVVVNLANLQR